MTATLLAGKDPALCPRAESLLISLGCEERPWRASPNAKRATSVALGGFGWPVSQRGPNRRLSFYGIPHLCELTIG